MPFALPAAGQGVPSISSIDLSSSTDTTAFVTVTVEDATGSDTVYLRYRASSPQGTWETSAAQAVTGGSASFSLSGLVSGTDYEVQASLSGDFDGAVSATITTAADEPDESQEEEEEQTPTATATPTAAELAPSGLTAALESGEVTLSWEAPVADAVSVDGYEVLRQGISLEFAPLADLSVRTGTAETSWVDAGVSEPGVYTYAVRALRGEEASGLSEPVSVTVNPPIPESTATVTATATATQVPTATPTPTARELGPSNLSFEIVEAGVVLSWEAPAADADGVTGYRILRRQPSKPGQSSFLVWEYDTGSTVTTYTDRYATEAGESYVYRVIAIRGEELSRWSNFVKAKRPKPADITQPPRNLSFEIEEDGIVLSWEAPAENAESVTGYQVLRRLPGWGQEVLLVYESDTGSVETSWTDIYATTAGQRYVYGVIALRGDAPSRLSNVVDAQRPQLEPAVTPAPAPTPTPEPEESGTDGQAPSNLGASYVTDDGGVTFRGVELSWDAPVEDAESVTGYAIERAVGEGSEEFVVYVVLTGSAYSTYTDPLATTAGETYTYRMVALRGEDRSEPSNEASVILAVVTLTVRTPTPTPEPVESVADGRAPSGLSASYVTDDGGVTYSGVELSWDAPSEDAESVTGYEIERAAGVGSNQEEFTTLVADTASADTAYTDSTATTAGETYTYRVRALRGGDRSEPSGQASVILSLITIVEVTPTPTPTPEPEERGADPKAPSGLSASYVTDDGGVTFSGVELSWAAPVEDAESVTGYEIERAVGAGSNQGEFTTLVADTASAGTAYTDAAATAAYETYAYRVTALRGEDRSEPSNEASVSLAVVTLTVFTPTPTPTPTPEPGVRGADPKSPSGLSASYVTDDGGVTYSGVELSWDAPVEDADSVTGYEIERATGAGSNQEEFTTLVADTASADTAYTDGTATAAYERYTYRVTALRGKDRSEPSNEASVSLAVVTLTVITPTPTPEPEYDYHRGDPGHDHNLVNYNDPRGLSPAYVFKEDGSFEIVLTWQSPAQTTNLGCNLSGYRIARTAPGESETELVADTASTATTYTDTTAALGTYTYSVYVHFGTCTSSYLIKQLYHSHKTLSSPESTGPTGLEASFEFTGVSLDEVSLSWVSPEQEDVLVSGTTCNVTGYRITRTAPGGSETVLETDTASTDTSYSDTTAALGTYTYEVTPHYGSCGTGRAVDVTVTDRISILRSIAPTGLEASHVGKDGGSLEIALSWQSPDIADAITLMPGCTVSGYRISRSAEGESETVLAADTASTDTSYTDTTAALGTYTYEVAPHYGDCGTGTAVEVNIDDPSSPPTGLEGFYVWNDGSFEIALSWQSPETEGTIALIPTCTVSGYRISRSAEGESETVLAEDTASTTTSYTDTTAALGTYIYEVAPHYGGCGTGVSAEVIVVKPTVASPTELSAQIGRSEGVPDRIELVWAAPSRYADLVTGYKVLRGAEGDTELRVLSADTGSEITVHTDTDIERGQRYTYSVIALSLVGESERSGTKSITVPYVAADLAPQDLTAGLTIDSMGAPTGASLGWEAPLGEASDVTGYKIMRSVGDAEATELASVLSSVTTYADTTATAAGQVYTYEVVAVRDSAESLPSGRASVLVPAGTISTATAADAPTGLVASIIFDSNKSPTGVYLQWEAPAGDASAVTSYEVLRSEGSGLATALFSDTGSSSATAIDTTVEWGKTYHYGVIALRGSARSAASNRASVMVEHPTLYVPATPTSETEERVIWSATVTPGGTDDGLVGYGGGVTGGSLSDDEFTYRGVTYTVKHMTWDFTYYGWFGLTYDSLDLSPELPESAVATWLWYYCCGETLLYGNWLSLMNRGAAPEMAFTSIFGFRLNDEEEDTAVVGNAYPVSLSVRNEAAEGVPVIIGEPRLGDTVTADVSGITDANGMPLDAGFTYEWISLLEGIATTRDITEPTYTVTGADVGSRLKVRVSFNDGDGFGESVQSEATGAVPSRSIPQKEFNTLMAAGNNSPGGIWSDGTTMWVAHIPTIFIGDTSSAKLFAYDMATKARVPARDFNTLDAAGNDSPTGIWSDGTTMWVADESDDRIYAYDMETKARKTGEEFSTGADFQPGGIWSDGGTMWVASSLIIDNPIDAYDLESKARRPAKDFNSTPLFQSGVRSIAGIWSDGSTMWVADKSTRKILAFRMSTKLLDHTRKIDLSGLEVPYGIWSDGSTMWAADRRYGNHRSDTRLYAYGLPVDTGNLRGNPVSVERITNTSAVVSVDLSAIRFHSGFNAGDRVPLKMHINYGGYTIYALQAAGKAEFMLVGMDPETEYTVTVKFAEVFVIGVVTFRTTYPKVGEVRVSHRTPESAKVTVHLKDVYKGREPMVTYQVNRNRDGGESEVYLQFSEQDDGNEGKGNEGKGNEGKGDGDDKTWSKAAMEMAYPSQASFSLSGLTPGGTYDLQAYLEEAETESVGRSVGRRGVKMTMNDAFTLPQWPTGPEEDWLNICGRDPQVVKAILSTTAAYDSCEGVSPIDLAAITYLDDIVPVAYGTTRLKAGDFDGLTSLEELDLSGMKISELPEGVFRDLESLRVLSLADNRIHPRLKNGVFSGLSNMGGLDLRGFSRNPGGITNKPGNLVGRCWTLNQKFMTDPGYAWDPRYGSPRAFAPLTSLGTYNVRGDLYVLNYEQPPAGPENLSVTEADGVFTLTWDAPAGQSGITGYRVERTVNGHNVTMQLRSWDKDTGECADTGYTYLSRFDRVGVRMGETDQDTRSYTNGSVDDEHRLTTSASSVVYHVFTLTEGNESIPVSIRAR